MLNYDLFVKSMAGLCELFERQQTDALLDIYYQALSDLTDDQFRQGIAAIVRGKKFNKLPLPGEILDAVGGNQSAALLALDKAERAVEKHGSYSAVIFDDPVIHMVIANMGGWPRFCAPSSYGDDREWHWIQKEFVKLYEAFSKSQRSEFPTVLVGLSDTSYVRNGETVVVPPKIIGDQQKALEWTEARKQALLESRPLKKLVQEALEKEPK